MRPTPAESSITTPGPKRRSSSQIALIPRSTTEEKKVILIVLLTAHKSRTVQVQDEAHLQVREAETFCAGLGQAAQGRGATLTETKSAAGTILQRLYRTSAHSRLHSGDQSINTINTLPAAIEVLIHKITGMVPNPYPMGAIPMAVDRKQKKIIPHHKINGHIKLLKHLPQLSPHTRVCGMRRGFDKTNSTLRLTLKTKTITYQRKTIPLPTKTTLEHSFTTMHKNKITSNPKLSNTQNHNTHKMIEIITTSKHKHTCKSIHNPNPYPNIANIIHYKEMVPDMTDS